MNCPYCKQPMKLGVIQSSKELSWQPRLKVFSRAEFDSEATLLSPFSFWQGSAVAAYRCEGCQKIVIDYSESNSDYFIKMKELQKQSSNQKEE